MTDFRLHVSAIMAGTAPNPSVIPATDAANRPTLRRGDSGDLVRAIRTKLGIADSGEFDADMEAALRQFQRDQGLVPDGIVGPRTWAVFDAA
jgi:peptidoglycan hydrolase-like protein with peptidoglycan-binding domain